MKPNGPLSAARVPAACFLGGPESDVTADSLPLEGGWRTDVPVVVDLVTYV